MGDHRLPDVGLVFVRLLDPVRLDDDEPAGVRLPEPRHELGIGSEQAEHFPGECRVTVAVHADDRRPAAY